MDIQTSNFGTQSINADDIISFPQAMIGLEDNTQFKLFHQESDAPTVHYLQSISDADISMSLVSPEALDLEYEIELSDDEQKLIKLDDPKDAVIAVVVYMSHEQNKSDEDTNLKVIAKSPIIINIASQLAMQKQLPNLQLTH